MKWRCLYNFRGETTWMTLGDDRNHTTNEARDWARRLIGQVADGRDPRQEQIEKARADTFWELMDKFIAEYAEKSLKRWDQISYLLGRFVPTSFRELKANEITTADVGAVIRPLTDRPVLARQVLAAISSVFGWGADFGLVASNPCRQIRRKRFKTKSRERVLSDEELKKLWREATGEAGRALRLLTLTGQRPGEVAALRLEDVGVPNGTPAGAWWTLPGEPARSWPGTKNGVTHRVWIPAAAIPFLPTATSHRHWEYPAKLRRKMWKLMKRIIPRTTPHDLRRTHGTMITKLLGFGGEVAMDRIQNHVRRGVTGTYDRHDYSAEIIDVMERVAARVVELTREGEVIDVMDRVAAGLTN
jgi:integrase